MRTESRPDRDIFYRYLLAPFVGLLSALPFFITSRPPLLLGVGYMAALVGLLLMGSMTLSSFVVEDGCVLVTDWFGMRRRSFRIPDVHAIKCRERVWTPTMKLLKSLNNNKFDDRDQKLLTFYTPDGWGVRIDSRFIRNFDEVHRAILAAAEQNDAIANARHTTKP
jgi:hypothetical protein